jgi:hypothetical protein
MNPTANKPATWFWIVTILALLWNLGGVMSLIMHITISDETLQGMSEDERELYTDFPMWVTVTYFIAVFCGLLGNVLLLLRRRIATPVLIVSFVAILLQMLYTVFMSRAVEIHGPQALGVPIFVTVIGFLLILLSRHAASKGWLR